jgi:hypothetical protein
MDGPGRPDVPPEDPRRPRVFSPEPLTNDRPHVRRWAALGLIALLVVVAKPWDVLAPPRSSDGGGPSAGAADVGSEPSVATHPTGVATTPVPSLRDDTAGPEVAAFCLDPGIWLVATVEAYGRSTLRIWRALATATSATGPDDPDIPTTTIQSEGVRELGWCAPVVGPDRPTAGVELVTWRTDGLGGTGAAAAPTVVELIPVRPPDEASPFGAMYGPPTEGGATGGAGGAVAASPDPDAGIWPDGRIVFRYASGTTVRWFALEVARRVPPGRAR